MIPKYRVGQLVLVQPAGLIFDGTEYMGTITKVSDWDDDFGAFTYHVRIPFSDEVREGVILEYEIVRVVPHE